SDSGYHDFKDGSHVAIDILAPKTDGTAYTPPGIAKPTITKMKAPAGASAAQAQAIAQTVAKLAAPADKSKSEAKPAEVKAEAKPEVKTEHKPAETKTPPDTHAAETEVAAA